MDISYRVDKIDITAAIKSASTWQQKSDNVTEDSTNTELTEAFVSFGIAQGIINCLKQQKIIDRFDFESLSMNQLRIRNKLDNLKKWL